MNESNQEQLYIPTPAALAAAETAKQRVQAAYTIALKNPRNQDRARQNILAACKRPGFAEKAEFKKPVGGGNIVGPSIRFAELALREWGNVMSDIFITYEDREVRRLKIIITDLETNTQFTKEVSVQKTVERKSKAGREVIGERINTNGDKVYIVSATEDELSNKESAMVSKAVRNEGLRLIPTDITEEALEACRQTVKSADKKDPDAARKKLIDSFAGLGIRVSDLEKYLGHSTTRITPAEIADLRTVYQTIKDGEAKWEDYIADQEKKTPTMPEADAETVDQIGGAK